jgi:hypothetical protein
VIPNPATNLIRSRASTEELERRVRVLRDLDYSPYAFKGPEGKDRLQEGLYTRERAKSRYEELRKRGIENQIVKR